MKTLKNTTIEICEILANYENGELNKKVNDALLIAEEQVCHGVDDIERLSINVANRFYDNNGISFNTLKKVEVSAHLFLNTCLIAYNNKNYKEDLPLDSAIEYFYIELRLKPVHFNKVRTDIKMNMAILLTKRNKTKKEVSILCNKLANILVFFVYNKNIEMYSNNEVNKVKRLLINYYLHANNYKES